MSLRDYTESELRNFTIYIISASVVLLVLALVGIADLGFRYYVCVALVAFIHLFVVLLNEERTSRLVPLFAFIYVPVFYNAHDFPLFSVTCAGVMVASLVFALKNYFIKKQAWKEPFNKYLSVIFEEYCQFQTEPAVKYINNILDTAKQKLPAAEFKQFLHTVNVEEWCMGKVSEYILESICTGRFHVWREALGLEGEAMARAYHQIIEEMRTREYISEDEYEIANDNIYQAIKSV